jgi:Fe-S-cluster-containing dehydrogenase component
MSAATGTSLLLAGATSEPPTAAQRPKHAILVDASKCIACMRCVAGCETYHREYEDWSAPGTAYTKVAVLGSSFNLPELCLHCFDAPCANACITHALTQLDYGAVVYDSEKCIGCLLCVNQCPFGTITFNPIDRKIQKCVMCYKAVEEGKSPYCVKSCPTGARSFGLYEDKLAEGMELAGKRRGVLLYPRDTSTLYVLPGQRFEEIVNSSQATVIKKDYPIISRLTVRLLKYSRLAWIPMTLGVALYVLRLKGHEPKGDL